MAQDLMTTLYNAYSVHLTEQDFWQPGIRAVMFTQPVKHLLPGATLSLYITTGKERDHGEY
ncbi:hypothetical protein [Candidatus Regiella endosymbiont of Tuberolachnus salignus]|uniref:hypothetical protein n=1 Tax=Candidatus Regiella endosymbiont of Tuberolachnus salignus TaxID=3077956 RepID=UPI0030CBCA2F